MPDMTDRATAWRLAHDMIGDSGDAIDVTMLAEWLLDTDPLDVEDPMPYPTNPNLSVTYPGLAQPIPCGDRHDADVCDEPAGHLDTTAPAPHRNSTTGNSWQRHTEPSA